MHKVELANEKVVGSANPDHLLRRGGGLQRLLDQGDGTARVGSPAQEQLRLGAAAEELIRINAVPGFNGSTERDESCDPGVSVAGTQCRMRAERKAGGDYRQPVCRIEPLDCRKNISPLSQAEVVLAFAAAGTAKVEAQYRKARVGQGFHRVIHDLVVQGAPKKWVRMAQDHGCARIATELARIEQRFEASCRTSEIVDGSYPSLTRPVEILRCCHCFIVGLRLRAKRAWRLGYAGGVNEPEQKEAIRLLRRLMDIDSTTYREGEAGIFLAEYLRGRGFQVETTAVPQPGNSRNTFERWNVYAAAQAADPLIVFSTHIDTVPPWIPSSEDEHCVYGRGACDAKGIAVAMILAAEQLRERGLPVALLFVVGEERDSAGAKLANLNPKGSRFLINGEPTDNRIALASKGALRASVTAAGTMGHSAYPELGESAIHKLVYALEAILGVPLPELEDVGPSTLNIGLLEGGHAPNVIADRAAAQILVRLVGSSEQTRAAIAAAAAPYASVDYVLEIPFVRLRAMEGLPTMIASFTTDIPALPAWGEPLLLGPGSIHVAHTPGEYIRKQELWEAIALYARIAEQLAEREKQ